MSPGFENPARHTERQHANETAILTLYNDSKIGHLPETSARIRLGTPSSSYQPETQSAIQSSPPTRANQPSIVIDLDNISTGLILYGGVDKSASTTTEAPNMIIHAPLNGEDNKVINFAQLAEQKSGCEALHPRLNDAELDASSKRPVDPPWPSNRTPSFTKRLRTRKGHPHNESIRSKSKPYPVPKAPHQTTFFRSQSKRPLKKGELLNESDDDLEIGWLIQKHSGILEEIPSLGISEKDFLKTFDSFTLCENLASGCYLPDAILRYIKSNKSWLQDHDISSELFKLVTKLMVDGAVPDNFIKTCHQTLQGGIEKGESRTCESVERTNLKRGDDMCKKCCQIIATRRHSMICSNRVRSSIHAPLNVIF
jgi:hypothetical protein